MKGNAIRVLDGRERPRKGAVSKDLELLERADYEAIDQDHVERAGQRGVARDVDLVVLRAVRSRRD